MDKLKPCPFCGHEAMISYNSNYDFQAYCTNDACFMSQIIMEDMETEEQARAAWNKRAPAVPSVPLDKLCEWLAGNAWHLDCSDCEAEHCDCIQLHDDSGSSPAFWKAKLTKWMEEWAMEEWAMEEQREEEP